MLSVSHVSYHVKGRNIIDSISFDVSPGGILALVGPNGAGKTTLLRCLSGYYQPSSGSILLDGKNLPEAKQRTRLLSYLPHQGRIMPGLSVQQAIMLGRKPYLKLKVSAADQQAVDTAMETLGIAHLASKTLDEISAGERQRTMLARLLAQDTKIMLLDEPLNNLDPAQQLKVLAILRALAARHNKSIVMSMHDLNLISRFCPQALLLHGGKQIALGAVERVLTASNLQKAFAINMLISTTDAGMKNFIPLA